MSSTAVITGYSSGLGRSISEILLGHGWTVVGVARGEVDAAMFGDARERVLPITGSVTDQRVVDGAFQRAEEVGGASLLVNCAGQGCFGEIGSYSAVDVLAAIEGNLAGLMIFSDAATRHMAENGGDIVNVMSTAAKKYRPAESVYTAAKWGAKAYTRTLRDAIKARKLKIRVFEVYPCGMNTPFWDVAIRPVADGSGFPDPKSIASVVVESVLRKSAVYEQELTFERS